MYGFIDAASDHQNHVVVMKMIVNIDALLKMTILHSGFIKENRYSEIELKISS